MSVRSFLERWMAANREFLEGSRRLRAQAAHMPAAHPQPDDTPATVAREAQAAFFLSTGRCGTRLLTEVLAHCSNVDVHHDPQPELVYPGRLAYARARDEETFRFATWMARYEHVRRAWYRGLVYVETNNRTTFFAPWLAQGFAAARFVHLVRHPWEFIHSGLRRRYYLGNVQDEGRIRPRPDDPAAAAWPGMTPVQKIAWLWNATNLEIETFKAEVPGRVLTVSAERLFRDVAATQDILAFIGAAALDEAFVRAAITTPVNAQPAGTLAPPAAWSAADRAALRPWLDLAPRYGYDLD